MEHASPLHGPRLVVSPGTAVIGRGAVEQTGDHAATHGDHALLVATEAIYDVHGDTVERVLREAGLDVTTYADVRPDPTVENIEAAHERWESDGCDVLVTLGGGSSIDAGKGVGILATNGGEIRDYGVDRAGYEGVPTPIPPLVAVNTTAGTGSEATRSVVVSDEGDGTKFLIVSCNVVPEVAIEDPTLTMSLPQNHTAFTGIDALTHAIEAFVSVKSHGVSDDYARAAIRRIVGSLSQAWANGENMEARTDMMIGQLRAGQAFTNASVALVHGMARPLGAQLHLPHGLANGLLLPYVMEFSVPGAPEEYAELARLMDAADADTPDRVAARAAPDAVSELCDDIRLASYLDEFGDVPDREEYLDVVPEMAQDAIDSGSPENNPRKPTRDELEALFVTLYDDALAADASRRS